MKRIDHRDDLPKHLKVLAHALEGQLQDAGDTEFYEMSNIDEFERGARGDIEESIRYEIVPTEDTSTGRAFLVGFDTAESKIITVGLSYVQLKIYYVEVASSDFRAWMKRITQDRDDQFINAAERKDRIEKNRQRKLQIKEET